MWSTILDSISFVKEAFLYGGVLPKYLLICGISVNIFFLAMVVEWIFY